MKKICSVMALVFALIFVAPIVFPQTAVEVNAAVKTGLVDKSDTIEVNEKTHVYLFNKDPKAKFTYTSNRKSVATVSKKGVVTGKAVGTAKITVKQKLKGKVTKVGVFTVKVKKAEVSEHQLTNLVLPWEEEGYTGDFDIVNNTMKVETWGMAFVTFDIQPEDYRGKIKVLSSDPEVVCAQFYDRYSNMGKLSLEYEGKVGKSTITIKAGNIEKSFVVEVCEPGDEF